MSKLDLIDLGNLTGLSGGVVTIINNNNSAIEAALENTLSRDGTLPNAMESDLDLNDNDVLNVGNLDASSIASTTVTSTTGNFTNLTLDGTPVDVGDLIATGVIQVQAGSNITVDSTDPQRPIVSSSAAGVTDGDKGDITVSSSGVVWTIDTGLDAAKIGSGTVNNTEFGYLDGVTSAIQTQIDTKQPLDSDLTSWAAITRASGFDTFTATPTSANLRALLTDEVGTGAAYFVGGALGTPASGTATNLTGTASGLTAGNVTTNANLTGPITSVGNATSIASQTGTGTTFAMSAGPTFTGVPAAPTAAVDTNTTQIATTAMVLAQAASATPLGNSTTAVVGTSTRFARADHVHPGRELLTTNRTYYVRTDGSDSNTGLVDSAGGGFLTIQKAVNIVYGLDLGGFDVTIQIKDGTYTAGAALNGPWVGKGTVTIQGNVTTPANVAVNVTSANAFQAVNYAIVTVKGFKVTTTTAGSAIYASKGGSITFDKMDFGAAASAQITGDSGVVTAVLLGSNTISGGAVSFAHSFNGAEVTIGYSTITVTGTPAFSAYFVGVASAHVNFEGTTFSGAATGQRFVVHKDGYINTNHQGLSFFPGNSAGAIYPGGQYDYFTENPPRTVTANFSVNLEDVYIINNKSGSSCTVTLLDPTLASTPKKLYVKNTQAQTLVSASSNVTPKAGGAAGTAILPATAGAWAFLVADGSTWVIMQSGT